MVLKALLFFLNLSIIILSPLTVHAIDSCKQLFSSVQTLNGPGFVLYLDDKSSNMDEVYPEYSIDLTRAHQLTRQLKPMKTVIHLTAAGEQAIYDPKTNEIFMSVRFMKNNKPVHPRQSAIVLTHEYSHHVIEHFLNSSPLWVKYKERWLNSNMDSPEFSKLMKIESIMTSYREFFSDLLTILVSKDLHSIENVIRHNKANKKEKLIQFRSRRFDTYFGQNKLHQWFKLTQVNQNERFNPYLLLSPLRAYVGEILPEVLQNLERHRMKRFVEKVAHILKHDFETRLAESADLESFDIVAFNQELGEQIISEAQSLMNEK